MIIEITFRIYCNVIKLSALHIKIFNSYSHKFATSERLETD